MELEYLPINKENIKFRPDRFIINISGQRLIFRTSWNPVAEGFFFDLFDIEGDPIILGKKIVYGQDMLNNILDDRIPNNAIIPLDFSGVHEREGITFNNFMREVKPWVFGAGDN